LLDALPQFGFFNNRSVKVLRLPGASRRQQRRRSDGAAAMVKNAIQAFSAVHNPASPISPPSTHYPEDD